MWTLSSLKDIRIDVGVRPNGECVATDSAVRLTHIPFRIDLQPD